MRDAEEAGTPAPDGRSTRWNAHRARRREQLVDAALEILGESGLEFGLDQVAARAGVTKPVIYRHFGDRASLLEAMGERATNRLMERLMPAVFADGTPLLERVRTAVGVLVGFFDEAPHVHRLLARPAPPGSRNALGAGKDYVGSALVTVLGEYLRAFGTDDREMAEVWAHGVVGFVMNVTERWLELRVPDRERVVEHLTGFVWAQIDGVARRHGVLLDPARATTPRDVARHRSD